MPWNFDVLNYGDAAANNIEVNIYIDGQLAAGPMVVGSLSGQRKMTIRFTMPGLYAGSHTFTLKANESRKIVESNYNNNSLTYGPYSWVNRVELVAVSFEPTNEDLVINKDEDKWFEFVAANGGAMDASSVPIDFDATFSNDNYSVAGTMQSYVIAKIPAHQSVSARVQIQFKKPCRAKLGFVLDKKNTLNDLDRENNEIFKYFTVKNSTAAVPNTATVIGTNFGTHEDKPNNVHTGDFTGFVDQAYTAFNTMSSVTPYDVYKYTMPTVQLLRGQNNLPNGTKVLQSDILTLFGHANYDILLFDPFSYESGGSALRDSRTGVRNTSSDWTSPTTNFQYAGLKSADMSKVGIISFIGCETADYKTASENSSECLIDFAVSQGAKAAVGFSALIHPWTEEGKEWIRVYNNSIANGNEVWSAVLLADAAGKGSDLSTSSLWAGDSSTSAYSLSATTHSLSDLISPRKVIAVNLPESSINLSKTQKTLGSDNQFAEFMENINPYFNMEEYKVTSKNYPNGNSAIFMTKYINESVETDVNYVLEVENGMITEMFYDDMPVAYSLVDEDKILERIRNFESNRLSEISDPIFPNAKIVSKRMQYKYSYQSGKLKLVCYYDVEHLDEDGAMSGEVAEIEID